MKNKLLATVLSIAMAASILTGCGNTTGGTGDTANKNEAPATQEGQTENTEKAAEDNTKEAAADNGEGIVIEVLSLKTEAGPQKAFQQIFDNFTAENPNVTFEVQSMSSDDLKTTLRARSASGEMPDIITWMKEVEPEFLLDLTGEEYLNNLNADTLAGANTLYDQKTYAMPIDNGYIGLYYNKDVLEANALQAPTTYDELVAACETLAQNGVTPFASSLSDLSVPYMSLIALFAETVFGNNPDWAANRDAGEVTIAKDEGWKKAFDILKDVVYKYSDPEAAYNQSYDDCAALLANGDVAFYGNGSWALSAIRDVNPEANIGLMPFPISESKEEAKLLCFPDTSLSICAASENVDTAKKVLAYIASEEAGKIWSENVKVSSAVTGVNVEYDPIAEDINYYISNNQFTPYGDRVLRSVFTDKLWETFSYYMLEESDWDSLASEFDVYWDKARDEQ